MSSCGSPSEPKAAILGKGVASTTMVIAISVRASEVRVRVVLVGLLGFVLGGCMQATLASFRCTEYSPRQSAFSAAPCAHAAAVSEARSH